MAVVLGFVPPGQAAQKPSESQLKAAYLYNFAKFIQWPDDAFPGKDSPLVLGLLGENCLAAELDLLAGRKVRDRRIEVRKFTNAGDVKGCHLLYISSTFENKLKDVLQNFRVRPIVTVGDDNNFSSLGGVVQFVSRRDRLRFIVNLGVAKANNIKVDSQLLSLAVEVVEAEGE